MTIAKAVLCNEQMVDVESKNLNDVVNHDRHRGLMMMILKVEANCWVMQVFVMKQRNLQIGES